jgi:hypothetical protein
MKRTFFLALVALAAAVCAPPVHAQTTPAESIYHTINESWTAPVSWNGTGPSVPCSATVTTYCVSGYTETLTPPVGVTGTNVLAVTTTSYSWSPGGALYCGTWTVSVVANWLDGNGVAAVSAPLTGITVVSCPFTASPATGLTSKVS